MFQVENLTPFSSNIALFPNEDAIETLYVIVKASFNIGQQWVLTSKQSKPVEADIYWGEPEDSSIKYASDYHTGKPNTDIIMNGVACAPDNKTISRQNVGLQVGSVTKTITVFGDREWNNGQITLPKPFQTMPLIYEKSFGGVHLINDVVDSTELRNPIGAGYAGSRSVSEMDGVSLPNLEDPKHLITKISDTPAPACFAHVSPAWNPRSSYVGTYDENWKKDRAPYLPKDFNNRFLNMAHPDLIYPGYLVGGEAVSISGMHPKGALNFNLPEINLTSSFHLDSNIYNSALNLETLILEPNQLQLSLVWRVAFECDKKALKIDKIQINLKR